MEQQQFELMGARKEPQPISDDVIRRQPTLLSVIKLSIQVSGLDEKEIYIPLGIDKATWSKILSGQFNFPTNKYEQFMDLVGNEAVLVWLNFRRGYGMVPLMDAKDKAIRELTERNAQLQAEIETLAKYGVIRRAT